LNSFICRRTGHTTGSRSKTRLQYGFCFTGERERGKKEKKKRRKISIGAMTIHKHHRATHGPLKGHAFHSRGDITICSTAAAEEEEEENPRVSSSHFCWWDVPRAAPCFSSRLPLWRNKCMSPGAE